MEAVQQVECVCTDPALDGYVYFIQDREKHVWKQIVKDRRGWEVATIGTWREATEADEQAGKDVRTVKFKVASDCKCGKSEVTLKLVLVDA